MFKAFLTMEEGENLQRGETIINGRVEKHYINERVEKTEIYIKRQTTNNVCLLKNPRNHSQNQ